MSGAERRGGVRIKHGMDFWGGQIRAGKSLAWAARGVYIQNMRKQRCRLFLLGWMSLVAWFWAGRLSGETGVPEVKLTGIVNLPDYKRALIESKPTDARFKQTNFQILKEGEREGLIEVSEIDPVKGVARVRLQAGKTNAIVTLQLDGESRTPGTTNLQAGTSLQLHEASLEQVLSLYGKFCERTLLRPSLTADPVTLRAAPGNKPEAALVLQKALLAQGMTNIPDGKKFMMVLPVERAAMADPLSERIKPPARRPGESETKDASIVPAGEINFPGIDCNQFLFYYAALAFDGRVVDPQAPLLRNTEPIHLISQTPLTREEAIYALNTLFEWQNIKVIPSGSNYVKAVRMAPR
jgi:hypothetical protein